MANKLIFALLFCTLPITLTCVFAFDETSSPKNKCLQVDECNASPPDSFHITGAGSNFISLAWIPSVPGADHQLSIFKKNQSGSWDSLYSVSTGPTTYYTFHNLQYNTKYRFKIATKCINSGEVSEYSSILDGITLILDLVLEGRAPINPTVYLDCPIIDYLDHEWVGFKIERNSGATSLTHFFEFGVEITTGQVKALVKRVVYEPQLVVGFGNVYPKKPNPTSVNNNGSTSMRVFHVKGLHQSTHIGYLEVTFDDDNHTIKICKSPFEMWNGEYSFAMITAESPFNSPTNDNRFINDLELVRKPSVQSPFKDVLNIFLQQAYPEGEEITVHIININGQTVLKQQFFTTLSDISVDTGFLSPGLYVLRIETSNEMTTSKVVKPD